MIIYNVTINIDHDVEAEWLQWMKEVHIPQVMQSGLFTENRILRLLTDENSGGTSYAFQYYCESKEKYEEYKEKFAPALQAEVLKLYKDKFVAFRTLLEVIK